MRVLLLLAALMANAMVDKAEAGAIYPWCATYGYYGVTNCGFATLAQCQAAVSGVGGFCQPNAFYPGPARDGPPIGRARFPEGLWPPR